jgi:peptide/nickel transport system ATP-binding protein
MSNPKPLLEVRGLAVRFDTGEGEAVGVRDISLTVREGMNLAVVGESGCGKSVTSLACLDLLGPSSRIVNGTILFDGRDLTAATEKEFRTIRGRLISMIFQEPMTSLNPVLSIEFQLSEAMRLHTKLSKKEIRERSLELLSQVGMGDTVLKNYPHELSGGMRQRVMIAMALACNPRLLIADEPTTALDVTVQAQILALLRELQEKTGITIMIITHDFGVVAEMADDVVVMYSGYAVETGSVEEIFLRPAHPYTSGLLKSIIRIDASMGDELYTIPGMVPAMSDKEAGCPFYDRCAWAEGKCGRELPPLAEISPGHFCRCFLGRNG